MSSFLDRQCGQARAKWHPPEIRAPAKWALLLWACFAAIADSARADQEGGPRLSWPVACTPGADCFIQNYVDIDPGPEHRDLGCGWLSYQGHRGTDIALRGYDVMRDGVSVLVAADGVVKRTRDGMRDVNVKTIDRAAIKGRWAGNSVVVDHGGGWRTVYSHLRRDSVSVKPGQSVRRGQRLGSIGLSGATAFPHLDFMVLYRDLVVDPFLGLGAVVTCPAPAGAAARPMWSPRGNAPKHYVEAGLVRAGIAAAKTVDIEKALDGAYDRRPTTNAPALLAWAVWFGGFAGDRDGIALIGPDGRVIARTARTRKTPGARRNIATRLLRPDRGWRPGTYALAVAVGRADGRVVVRHRQSFELRAK